jgi:hypothetical protein
VAERRYGTVDRALHARVVDEGLDDYDAEKNEFTQ